MRARALHPAQGYAPAASGSAAVLPHELAAGYAAKAPLLAVAMLAVVAVRVHEVLPLIPLLRPALLITVGGFIYAWSKTGSAVRRAALSDRTIRLVLLYYAWCIATLLTSLWRGQSIASLRAFLPAVLLTITIMLCPPRKAVLDHIQFLFVVLIGMFGFAALQASRGWGGRLEFGGMYDSNDLAAVMTIGFPLAIGSLTRGTGKQRLIAGVCAASMLFTVVATGSRGGFLGYMAAVLVLAWGLKGTRRIWVVGLMMFAMLIAWGTSSRMFKNRVRSLTNLENDYNYTSDVGRKAVWARGRGYIRAHPFLGVGIGNFPVAEGATWTSANRSGKWSTAHNAYIQAGAELGIPGGALYILLLVNGALIAVRLSRGMRLADGTWEYRADHIAALAGFSTSAVFLSHAYFNGLFALLGLIALTERSLAAESRLPVLDRVPADAPLPAAPIGPRHGERGGLAHGVAYSAHANMSNAVTRGVQRVGGSWHGAQPR